MTMSQRIRCLGKLALLSILALSLGKAPLHSAAAGGIVSGRVANAGTGDYLRNATVSAAGTNITTTTGDGGEYLLADVPAGSVTIRAGYDGLDASEAVADVTAGGRVVVNFDLAGKDYETDKDLVKMGRFVVSGNREGNAKAVLEQKNAINMKSVVASDAFGNVSEGNVGEFLKFLPGITMDTVEADMRQVRIRGMDPKYAVVMMDGAPVASAGSSTLTRAFEFEQLSITSIETVELSKTPTPADNASAVAGVINLRSKGAFDHKGRRITVKGSIAANSFQMTTGKTPGWDNQSRRKLQPNLMLSYSDVWFRKLGVMAGVNYSYTFAEQKSYSITYATDNKIANNDTEIPKVTVFNPWDSPKPTERVNYNIRLDYKFSPWVSAFVRADYNTYDASTFGRSLYINMYPTNGVNWVVNSPGSSAPADPNVEYSLRSQTALRASTRINGQSTAFNKTGSTTTLTAGIGFKGARLSVDGLYQYSKATNHYQDLPEGYFRDARSADLNNVTLRFNRAGGSDPALQITQLTNSLENRSWRDPASYTLDSAYSSDYRGQDIKWSGKIDFRYAGRIGVPVLLKWGAAAAGNTKDTVKYKDNSKYTFNGADKKLSSYMEENYTMNFYYGGNIDGIPNWDRFKLAEMYRKDPALFTPPADLALLQLRLQNTYDFKEEVDAIYFQAIGKFGGKLTLAPGFRAEQTDSEGEGVSDIGDPAARRMLGLPATGGNTNTKEYVMARYGQRQLRRTSYSNLFHYLHATWAPVKNLMLRASCHEGITRPDIANILPGIRSVNENNQSITINNPDLKPEMSANLNASIEYYLGKYVGTLSVTAFRSDLKNLQRTIVTYLDGQGKFTGLNVEKAFMDYLDTVGIDPDTHANWRVTTYDNIAKAHLGGIELNYSQQLSFLPGVLRGIGVFANYTKLRFDNPSNFLRSSPETANAGLSYKLKRFEGFIKANWVGDRQTSTPVADGQNNAGSVFYQRQRIMYDLDINFRLTRQLSLFVNGRNIFNAPQVNYRNTPDVVTYWGTYGAIWTFGINGRF